MACLFHVKNTSLNLSGWLSWVLVLKHIAGIILVELRQIMCLPTEDVSLDACEVYATCFILGWLHILKTTQKWLNVTSWRKYLTRCSQNFYLWRVSIILIPRCCSRIADSTLPFWRSGFSILLRGTFFQEAYSSEVTQHYKMGTKSFLEKSWHWNFGFRL